MSVELDIAMQPDARAPARARRAVRTLRGVVPGDRIADLELLVSELVTNAVQHAVADPGDDALVQLRIATRARHIDVAVTDPGGHHSVPLLRDPRDGHVSGWGLVFVDRLASSWGIEQEEQGGNTVWFHIPLDASDPGEGDGRRRSGLGGLLLG